MSTERLPHLETFAKAAELNSFTAAAQALGLTQAAVSQRIQALEKELGTALFQRQAGHVLLTEAGRRLHAYTQRILALYREAREEITGTRAPLAGNLSLAASSIPGEHLLPGLLAPFREKYPLVQIRVTVTDTQAVLTLVEQGQAHLGFVGGKADNPHLEFRHFGSDELVLVAPPAHPLSRRKSVPLAQFAAVPLILREAGSGSRWCLEQALARVGKSLGELRVALELGSNEAIKEAVLRGLGLAVLSAHAVQREVEAGQLCTLRVTGLPLAREMFVVRDRRRVLPAPAHLFLDLLASRQTAAPAPS